MKWLIEAFLGAIVGPLVSNFRAYAEGREARKQLALTGALTADVARLEAHVSALKKVAVIYAETDPALGDMLVDLGLQLRAGDDPDKGGSDVHDQKNPA